MHVWLDFIMSFNKSKYLIIYFQTNSLGLAKLLLFFNLMIAQLEGMIVFTSEIRGHASIPTEEKENS